MKQLIVWSLCLMISINSYSQKVTNKDIIGVWTVKDSTNNEAWIFDGTTMIDSSSAGKTLPLPYFLKKSRHLTSLHFFKKISVGINTSVYYLIKLEKRDTLKIQGGGEYIPTQWDDKELNTTVLIRTN